MGFRISLSSLFVVVFAAILLVASGNARAQAPQYTIETIVLTGDVAPGTGGSIFSRLDTPAINESGDVVFRGYLDGTITDYGFWTRRAGSLALLARTGDESPDSGGRTFKLLLSERNINELGEVIFWGSDTLGGLDTQSAAWAGTAGALREIARTGDLAPGTFGRTFRGVSNARLNDLGDAAFGALLETGSSTIDAGIWRESNGVLELVARKGDVAPQAGGGTFDRFFTPDFNSAGQVAFRGVLSLDFTEVGLWVGDPNILELVALAGPAGSIAPGTGRRFLSVGIPNQNAAGAVAFDGFLEGSGPATGIWAGQPGFLELVALSDQVAPGSDGKTFESFGFSVINGANEVALRAAIVPGTFETSSSDLGIWVWSGGILNFVTRIGIDVPGVPGRTFVFFNPPVLNAAGEVAFDGSLDDSDPFTDRGIWAGSPGNLGLVVRAGDVLEVRPGDFRTIGSPLLNLFASGNDDSRGSAFSDSGQVVFAAQLTDGSEGIFLASKFDGNFPPTPNTGGPYAVNEGGNSLVLDASGSTDPNGNETIVSFEWDLDNDGQFDDATGVNPTITSAQLTDLGLPTNGPASFPIALRVTDDGGLLAEDTTTVNVLNLPPVAVAGADQAKGCTSAAGTQVTLNGSASSDAGGDPLTFTWTGPFSEGVGTVTGVTPTVTLPLGTSTVTLVVNDGLVDSVPDTVDVAVTVQVEGLQKPLAALVPSGEPVVFPAHAFEQGKSLPLKLKMFCGGHLLTDTEVAPPVIADLVRVGGATVDLETIDPDRGQTSDNGLRFRFSVGNWNYNLNTKDLIVGTYELAIEMPDGQQHVAGFMLK